MRNPEKDEPIRVAKPAWLKKKLPTGPAYERMRRLLQDSCLNTVCREAHCPNQFECYSRGTATFMILGERCSRNCTFCAVAHGPHGPPDEHEPRRVAEAVLKMGLKYCVITSVTRDDLGDGGASHFAATIASVRQRSPSTLVEVLIPDLQGNWPALEVIVGAAPEVLNHNVETVPRLYPGVRPQAIYQRSLDLLQEVKKRQPSMVTKSGIMLGLGESREELLQALDDLLAAGCDILTLGQYLQPSRQHHRVVRFLPPEEFAELEDIALGKGFSGVASGPSVRSSYEAGELYRRALRALNG